MALSGTLCRAARSILAGAESGVQLSRRATSALAELRAALAWIDEDTTAIVRQADGEVAWWTFAGLLANAQLAHTIGDAVAHPDRGIGNLSLRLRDDADSATVAGAIRHAGGALAPPYVSDILVRDLKFGTALPSDLARRTVATRLMDAASAAVALRERRTTVGLQEAPPVRPW